MILTLKYVFLLIMFHFLSLLETKYETHYTQLVEKMQDVKYYVNKKYWFAIIQFSKCDISINTSVVLNIFLVQHMRCTKQ